MTKEQALSRFNQSLMVYVMSLIEGDSPSKKEVDDLAESIQIISQDMGRLPPQPTQPEQGGQPQFQKHMARLEETFERWKNSRDDSINFYNSGMISALGGFFHKYRNHQTPTPGRFVPESEIQILRREVETAWNESDFGDAYQAVQDFLKAIDKEGGQDE